MYPMFLCFEGISASSSGLEEEKESKHWKFSPCHQTASNKGFLFFRFTEKTWSCLYFLSNLGQNGDYHHMLACELNFLKTIYTRSWQHKYCRGGYKPSNHMWSKGVYGHCFLSVTSARWRIHWGLWLGNSLRNIKTLPLLAWIRMNTSRLSDGLRVWPFVGKLFGTEILSSLRFVKSLYLCSRKQVVQKAIENSNLLNMSPRFEKKTDS